MDENNLPRIVGQSTAIDFNKINTILILQNSNGVNKYIIADSIDGEKFYFEKCIPDLITQINGHADRSHIFRNITDNINTGILMGSKLSQIKNLLS